MKQNTSKKKAKKRSAFQEIRTPAGEHTWLVITRLNQLGQKCLLKTMDKFSVYITINFAAMNMACGNGQLEVVKYLHTHRLAPYSL
jgi:hypothetical protein